MMTLYSGSTDPYSHRCRIVLYEKDMDFEVIDHLTLAKPGSVTLAQYDAMMSDLVNYMVWMGEPAKMQRQQLGLMVLGFLAIFFVVAYYLKKEFWKDIH